MLIARLVEFNVTVGAATTVATCTAVPLEPPLEVTTAVRDPRDNVPPSVAVSCVVVAAVTVAVPELKTTVLLAAVVEKLVPAMSICVALIARFEALKVTVGAATMVATCTAPVDPPKTVTLAVREPRDSVPPSVTVSWVAVAAVTVAVPELKTTVLLAAVVEKLVPAMSICVALIARFEALKVTVGAATMVATCTAPVDPPKTVTLAVREPRDSVPPSVTVSWVAVAAVTVAVPELKTTVLLAAVVEKLVPATRRLVALLIARLVEFNVTVGAATMVATCTAVPLEPPLEVTTAVRDPKDCVPPSVTVSCVAVAAVTVAVPELKTTVLLAVVVEKPVPAMRRLAALLIARLVAFNVTAGAATTVAT